MKLFLGFLLSISALFGATKVVKVDERFQSSQSCKACHLRIVKEWKNSWHAKSHYNSDEYFAKSLEYAARKTRKSVNSMKVQCATCHNPRISVTSTDEDYEIAAVMGLDKGSKVDKAVNDKAISEGINCVVCHNIDKIHDERDASKRGINRVSWTPSGTMTGPYSDAKSPYHKIVYHEFMDKNPNKLCFVCHANDTSARGVVFTNMQQEYKGKQTCVSCHMGKKRRDVAATYKMYDGKAKIREVHNHGFKGAHTTEMWVNALRMTLLKKKSNLFITIKNPQPHNIPSGFGARELVVKISFFKGSKILESKTISLTSHYKRRKGKIATPHTALQISKNMSIPAKGEKVLKVAMIKDANKVKVELYYVLVNTETRTLLKLKKETWSKEHLISKESLKF